MDLQLSQTKERQNLICLHYASSNLSILVTHEVRGYELAGCDGVDFFFFFESYSFSQLLVSLPR